MKAAWSMLLLLGVVLALVANVRAEDKEVTIKGNLVCGMCVLKETKVCTNVVQVKVDGKTVNYFLVDKGNKEVYHKNCCGCATDQKGFVFSVTGVVTGTDGKKYLKPSKLNLIEIK